MRPTSVVAATASVLLFALTGCSEPTTTQAPTFTPSPRPAASGPLRCDNIVAADLVATALEGADGVPVVPVAAVNGVDVFNALLLEGAGGLPCSWRVGGGMPEYDAPSDWAYLRIDVLPGAAAQWVPLRAGDGPSPDIRQIAGVEASVAGGDPGWAISAPVGDSWVITSISAAASTSSGGRFAGLEPEVIIDRLAQVAGAAFASIQKATAAQLERPSVGLRQADAVCEGGPDGRGVVAAMQLPPGSAVDLAVVDAAAAPPTRFDDAIRAAARTFDCEVRVDGITELTVTIAHGFSPLVGRFHAPDADVALSMLELADAPQGTEAFATGSGRASTVYLSIGGSLYAIVGERAPAVGQAIAAHLS